MNKINDIKSFFKSIYYSMNQLSIDLLRKLGAKLDQETPNQVVITKGQYLSCVHIAATRMACDTWARRISKDHNQFQNILNGTISELVVSKWLRFVSWSPETTRPDTADGDLPGYKIQVRMTDHIETGHLIVKPWEPKNHVYVLVLGDVTKTDPPYTFTIAGYQYGKECHRGMYLREGGSYWIPQDKLLKPDKNDILANI
jgi:hypothetical protein